MASPSKTAAGASWMALVAATTIGSSEVGLLRADISGEAAEGEYRLVVQSYAPSSVRDGRPNASARPQGSLERPVSAEELRGGVRVELVTIGEAAEDAVLVAWLENDQRPLEFDALGARPADTALLGLASASTDSPVRVVLGAPERA